METKKRFKTIFIALIMIGTLTGAGLGVSMALRHSEAAVSSGAALSQPLMVPATFSDLAEKVRPGVVNLQVVKKVKNVGLGFPNFPGFPFGDKSPFGDFFGPSPQGNQPKNFEQRGVGSGFVISSDGYVLTNNHVVDGADEIKVKLSNSQEYKGKVVGRDPKTDLALLKINGASELHPLNKSLGLSVQDLTPQIAQGLGLKESAGVVVTRVEPESPAAEAGLQSGDVIREVNRKPVKNADDFVRKLEKAKGQDTVLLSIQRGNTRLFAAVILK